MVVARLRGIQEDRLPKRCLSLVGSRVVRRVAPILVAGGALLALSGCETRSFFDPSRTGYFERVPATMPVIKRIDVIEPEPERFGFTGPPLPADLVASPSVYNIGVGDVIKTEIYELISANMTETAVRAVDQSGNVRLPVLNDVHAAGLTVGEFETEVIRRCKRYLPNPIVTVSLEEGRAFLYTIIGSVDQVGEYKLARPDYRLRSAIATAGGVAPSTERIVVVRAYDPSGDSSSNGGAGATPSTDDAPTPPMPPTDGTTAPPPAKSIDDLINEIDSGDNATAPSEPPATPPATAPPIIEPDAPADSAVAPPAAAPAPAAVRPPRQDGLIGHGQVPPIDIDTLEPVSVSDAPGSAESTAAVQQPTRGARQGSSFIFDVQQQKWVRATNGAATGGGTQSSQRNSPAVNFREEVARGTRIIEIDYRKLSTGDNSQNVVIRPGDAIHVNPVNLGVVYVGGEVARPGVFNMPQTGEATLSRMIDAAGGLGQLAIPERCDLIRRIGTDREACIRLNLAAIRARTEPDIALRPDDHIIIGTNFWALPLAVMRNGFRMTYGFGFLLDRNWGNDVFGPPPQNIVGN